MSELHLSADSVPAGGRHDLVTVDGRCFAISDEAGDMTAATHGLVYDDLRHLSLLRVSIEGGSTELLAASTPSPVSAVVVSRVVTHVEDGGGGPPALGDVTDVLVVRRRWLSGGLVEELTLRSPHPRPVVVRLHLEIAADFAHVFDVKSGVVAARSAEVTPTPDGWTLRSPDQQDPAAEDSTQVRLDPAPDSTDPDRGTATWTLRIDRRRGASVTVTVRPVSAGVPARLERPAVGGTAIRELAAWRAVVPSVTSQDPRIAAAVEQALADLAALRIVDEAHPDRPVVAAGAPWFMTLFGRDSLLTSWMTLPFDASLAGGVLSSLADLQGVEDDPASEEQPGRIIHELRRHGGSGPFASRSRYYGTVDATPLFVGLAAEAWRWGAIGESAMERLAPAIGRAVGWTLGAGDTNGDGFLDYQRRDPRGLANQGWKDSWDGITRSDGTLPAGPVALVEVQGYAYRALRGAAELATWLDIGHDADELLRRAETLKERFNEAFWDPRGYFVLGLDGDGRRIDSLTTNPGHALWCGIADDDKARAYVDRLVDADLWTGWGIRTLASSMAAYDPISYHNGSVWPHDTALCIAGAAEHGCWDAVDLLVDGALEATTHFEGRPPELFAGVSRDDVPMPVAYPSSCSPQAWASASAMLLVRSMLGLRPKADGSGLELARTDLTGVRDLLLERLPFRGRLSSVRVEAGRGQVVAG
jgi:glycogen debranching enzyme